MNGIHEVSGSIPLGSTTRPGSPADLPSSSLHVTRLRLGVALGVMLGGFWGARPAAAQDAANDRAEFDLAAGRVLFQNSPLYDGVLEVRPPGSLTATAPAPGAGVTPVSDRPGRRPVRVVLPSPYAR